MEKHLNRFGVLLLAAAVGWSTLQVISRKPITEPDGVVIRFAHWQLEGGLREAFDELARVYMERNPGVRVEQMAVPGRVYPTWLRTAYAGGVIPDLIVMGGNRDEDLVLHYLPITHHVLQPNPHNQGTPLEGIPWRETFISGLHGSSGLNTLQDYYSVPMAELTIRMHYNADLWRELLGERPIPSSFEAFLDVCAEIERISAEREMNVLPLAGSRFTANVLLIPLFQSQTQKSWQTINPLNNLDSPDTSSTALAFLPGLAHFDSPEVHRGYSIMREVGKHLQPGFLQMDRDEAILMFSQQRAMMLPTGAWDYGSILEQARFQIGIFPLPFPSPGEGLFGENVLGKQSEMTGRGAGGFHLAARSQHPDIAIDFLKFMTSHEGNQIFSHISKWPPSVRKVSMPSETEGFKPVQDGFPAGFAVAPLMHSSSELARLQGQALHRLFDRNSELDVFLDMIRPHFDKAVRDDIQLVLNERIRSVRRADILLAATTMIESVPQESSATSGEHDRLSLLRQSQNYQELWRYRVQAHLEGRLLPSRRSHMSERNPE